MSSKPKPINGGESPKSQAQWMRFNATNAGKVKSVNGGTSKS